MLPVLKFLLLCSNVCFKAFEYFAGLDLFNIPGVLRIFRQQTLKEAVNFSIVRTIIYEFWCLIPQISSGLFNFLTYLDYIFAMR